MKKLLGIVTIAVSLNAFSQNPCGVPGAVVVEAFNFAFAPQVVNLEVGQSISWVNIGGSHDSQSELNSITDLPFDNPDTWDFPTVSGNPNGVCIGTFTFVIPGVYQYDCSVGNHALNGMVGTVIVGTGGCTDEGATNYNSDADYDDGSCFYAGCTDIAACNFDESADTDDGSCLYPGCMDPEAENYDENAGCEAECIYAGCLDNTACNYNPQATIDDQSCTYPGCINVNAVNYDETAGCDDGSCLFSMNNCLGDLNYDGLVNTADLLGLLAALGNLCLPE